MDDCCIRLVLKANAGIWACTANGRFRFEAGIFQLNKKSWALFTQLTADATGWHLTGYADQVAPLALRRCLSAGLPHILLLSLCTKWHKKAS
jgi:hypothetical protein